LKAYRWNGDKISRAGAYVGLPIEVYHGDPVAGRYVTASSLGRADRSLAHFWAYCPWNPDRYPMDETSDALRLGQCSHVLAFQPELFTGQFAISPYEDYRTKEARVWKETAIASGRLPIKVAEHANALRMADALRKNEDARLLFARGLPEISFMAKDEATGIWMLTRPDFTPAAPGRGLVDYKTSADGSWEGFGRSAYSYGYDIQAALALDVVAQATGELRPCMWHVVQEKEPPYVVSVHRWAPEQIMHAKRKVRDLLDKIAFAIESGEWPGYGPAQSLIPPTWMRREIERAEEAI